jgi:hypothetical protein
MLQDLTLSTLQHLPYIAAIIIGGLSGNAIADRQIKLPSVLYLTLAFLFVVSLCSQGYYLEHGPRVMGLLTNAICGALLAFALTVTGEFAPGKRPTGAPPLTRK